MGLPVFHTSDGSDAGRIRHETQSRTVLRTVFEGYPTQKTDQRDPKSYAIYGYAAWNEFREAWLPSSAAIAISSPAPYGFSTKNKVVISE